MKKESINNYYSEEDLINFKKLNNFSEIKNDIQTITKQSNIFSNIQLQIIIILIKL